MTLLGKMIGGGFPVGAVGGRADLMALTDPSSGRLRHTGTFNGNPVTMAAGSVSVTHLTRDRIRTMHGRARILDAALRRVARAAGVPFSTRRVGSLIVFFLRESPPMGLHREPARQHQLLHLSAAARGLHFAPRGLMALSTVFAEQDIGVVIEAFEGALRDIAQVIV